MIFVVNRLFLAAELLGLDQSQKSPINSRIAQSLSSKHLLIKKE